MKSAVSIFLAFLVLVATSGVGITKHYCGNRVASVSIFGDMGCSCGTMDDAHGCCRSERDFFQVDDDFSKTPVRQFSIASLSIVTTFVYRLSLDFPDIDHAVGYLSYKPPIPDRDVQVLMQSFLI